MVAPNSILAARGVTDEKDRLTSADQPLAELQQRCGGVVPGRLAVPELLELVQQGRRMGLKLAREFAAQDGESRISGFVRIKPLGTEHGNGCEILIENWYREPLSAEDDREAAARQDGVDRATAEFSARLDANQRLLAGEGSAPDLAEFVAHTREQAGKPWTEYVELLDVSHRQPLHWRLLDGANCKIAGSPRDWRARLIPVGNDQIVPRGFELLLVAKQPLTQPDADGEPDATATGRMVGDALAPALRKPVARIVSNAQTIKSKLAGPLREEYSAYASDILAAGHHLSGLLDDLAELDTVESPGFTTAKQTVDLSELAREAGAILSARAKEKGIMLVTPDDETRIEAAGDAKRILQVLLNLIGNAINYSPGDSEVTITAGPWRGGRPSVSVRDQGPGLAPDQRERVFAKFERLGRSGDGGSGLGLYISRRLAQAMKGDLTVESEPGKGACFTLVLPQRK